MTTEPEDAGDDEGTPADLVELHEILEMADAVEHQDQEEEDPDVD